MCQSPPLQNSRRGEMRRYPPLQKARSGYERLVSPLQNLGIGELLDAISRGMCDPAHAQPIKQTTTDSPRSTPSPNTLEVTAQRLVRGWGEGLTSVTQDVHECPHPTSPGLPGEE